MRQLRRLAVECALLLCLLYTYVGIAHRDARAREALYRNTKAIENRCLSQNFTVYFAPGKSELDWRAMATIREAVAHIRNNRVDRVVVQAFADTVGSPAANQLLSQRRAEAVRRVLLAEGVEASISTSAFGETGQAVQTPDNMPEQRNRRAHIVVTPLE